MGVNSKARSTPVFLLPIGETLFPVWILPCNQLKLLYQDYSNLALSAEIRKSREDLFVEGQAWWLIGCWNILHPSIRPCLHQRV